ncbi:MAG: hypothetical protein QOF44_957 [Streptomyces sp.]|nr:hypothetical protein [Streptomyces sp.]
MTDISSPGLCALPAGSRLVHIGPHKTGTTAVQAALFDVRERLSEHGVEYPGDDRHPMYAALAVTARPSMMGDSTPKESHWRKLVDEVGATGDRTTVVSSEFFAEADDEAIARIVGELGGERVHVVVTLRPLAKILPSQWQQYVQNGLRMGYVDWLEHMLRKPPYEQPNPSFWLRHRHDRLIERWTKAVGQENLTVIVVDDTDRTMLMRAFESLLGLPGGLLAPVPDAANRSLTLGEIEMVRRFNIEFRKHDLPEQLYSRLLRYGAVPAMKTGRTPTPDEPRVTTPLWAMEEAAGIGTEIADRITRLGVRVIGDLALLHKSPSTRSGGEVAQSAPVIDPEAGAQALFGAIAAQAKLVPVRATATGAPVQHLRSADLVKVLARRARRRLSRNRPTR